MTRTLLAAFCLAQTHAAHAQSPSPSPNTAHTVPSSLQTQVTNLTNAATTLQQKRRAATLQWALNEATYQFTTTSVPGSSPPIPIDVTASWLAGDKVTIAAPSGVAPSGTNDLEYSPLGIGDALVNDVSGNLSAGTPIGTPNSDQYPLGYNLYPKIPNYPTPASGQPVNPFAIVSIGPDNNNDGVYGLITHGSVVINTQSYNDLAVQAFGHPDSPYYGDPRLVPLIFNQMEAQYDSVFTNTNPSADFSGAPDETMQYLLVAARYPDLILPSCKKRWQASIYHQMALYYDYYASSDGPTADNPQPVDPVPNGSTYDSLLLGDPALAYPNNNFRVCEGLFNASIIFTSPLDALNSSPNVAKNFRSAVYTYFNTANNPAVEFPDGAFTYISGTNEVGNYQGAETQTLAHLYLEMSPLTGSTDVAARATIATMLENARLYVPLEYPSNSFGEEEADYPRQKLGFISPPYDNGEPVIHSLIPGLTTDTDPQLWRVLDESGSFAHQNDQDLYTAACLDTSNDPFGGSATAAKAADPDNYFVYDRDREGPDVRTGYWTMTGSARMVHYFNYGIEGVASFFQQASGSNAPTQLDQAANIVNTTLAPGGPVSPTSAPLGTDMLCSTIVQPTFATMVVAASLKPDSDEGSSLPFGTVQDWIYTPTHLIGMLTSTLSGSSSQQAYGIGGRLVVKVTKGVATYNVEAGAGTATPELEVGQTAANGTYAVDVNIKENTYGSGADQGGGTYAVYDYAPSSTKHTYNPGVLGHFLVDFHTHGLANVTNAVSVNTGQSGVYGLEVQDGAQMYRLIHNTTGSAVTYTVSLPAGTWGTGSVQVHHAEIPAINGSTTQNVPSQAEVVGETYRPAWVATNGKDSFSSVTPTYVALGANGNFSYSVPANSHILITSIQNMVDGAVYELEPVNAPGMRADVTGGGTANGTVVELYQRDSGRNQQWGAEAQGGGVFKLFPMHAQGSNLDVQGGKTANQTQVDITADVTSGSLLNAQLWTPTLQSNGAVELAPSCAPGSRMEVYNHGTTNGSQIEIWQNYNDSNQEWHLIRLNPVIGAPLD